MRAHWSKTESEICRSSLAPFALTLPFTGTKYYCPFVRWHARHTKTGAGGKEGSLCCTPSCVFIAALWTGYVTDSLTTFDAPEVASILQRSR